MEQWDNQGIILSVRRHGESGAVVAILTEEYGRWFGYVRGATGTKMRGVLEVGNIVDVSWQSRVADNMGNFTLELVRNSSAPFMQDALRLAALQSALGLCDAALPEREAHGGLFHGTIALFEALGSEIWGAAYVMWEISFLRELGFSLDLSRCAGGSDDPDLIYVSPKTGRAVSRSAGAVYKDKMLPLPGFLIGAGDIDMDAVRDGLRMSGYFLEHWAFTHRSGGMPEGRVVFMERVFA